MSRRRSPSTRPERRRGSSAFGKALRKNREERYQNVNDLLADLKDLARDLEFASEEKKRSGGARAESGEQLAARAESTPTSEDSGRAPESRRRPAVFVALAGLVVMAVVACFTSTPPPLLTGQEAI